MAKGGFNEFREVDKGYDEWLEDLLGIEDDDPHVTIGVHSEDASHKDIGINMAELMSIHEFGTEDIPARPVLRWGVGGLGSNSRRLADVAKSAFKKVNEREIDVHTAFSLLGTEAVGLVQSLFGDRAILERNADATILMKGSAAPLIDTGQLRASIDYQVHGTD